MVVKANLKHIRSLHRSKGRATHNQYIIEGRRLFQEALLTNEHLHLAYFTDTFQSNFPGLVKDVIKECPGAQNVSPAEMKTMSATETPSGILGVCFIPDNQVLDDKLNCNWLFLDSISEPGNMGTLLRTAAWFGINNISLSRDCVDIYNPKVVRSGMGAHFNITCILDANIKQFDATHAIIGADHKGTNLANHKIEAPWVLVLGNEAHGISERTRENINHLIAIPRIGTGESLNVATAGGILMEKLKAIN